MAPESAIVQSSKKDKKSKRKSLGDSTTAPIEVDASISTSESKPPKKKKKDAVIEKAGTQVQIPSPEEAVKKGKTKAKNVEENIVAPEVRHTKGGKEAKKPEKVPVDDAPPSVSEGMSKNAKKKLARKAVKESEAVAEDTIVETVKEKGKKAAKIEKVIREVGEAVTEEAEVEPKKAIKAGKEKITTQNSKVEKPVKTKKKKDVEVNEDDKPDPNGEETILAPSKLKRSQPISPPAEEATITEEIESKTKKRKKDRKEVGVEEAPEFTISVPHHEVTPNVNKGTNGKAKMAKNTKQPTTAPDTTPTSAPVDSAPSTMSAAQPSRRSKKSKAKEPSPELETVTPSDDEAAQSNSEHEHDHLHGFTTDDDDSSDEEDGMDFDPSAFDVGKLPTIAKDDAAVKRKLDKAKLQPTDDRGVIFLGRLPHGFFEDQMKAYFSQFGTVTRIRLSRNKKTGRSKHYGFVEFDSSAVAQIVADTMDNYLIMGHILRCKLIPKNEVHPELWVGANRKWRAVPRDRVTRVEHNKPRTEAEQARAAKRLIKRQNDRKRKLADTGIKYDFKAVSYKKVKELEV